MQAKPGFTSFQLKVIALILMTFDHIHYCLSTVQSMPVWLTVLGRMSAPLFVFTMAQGFYYTRSRKKYLLRLYSASVLMGLGNFVMNKYFPLPGSATIINNIFATLFLCGIYIWAIEFMMNGIKQKSGKTFGGGLLLFLLPVIVTVLILALTGSALNGQGVIAPGTLMLLRGLMLLAPSPLFVEGSVIWIGLGVGMYFLRNHKMGLTLFYGGVSLFFLLNAGLSVGFTAQNLFAQNPQWFMIAALPFMLLYNGQRGRSMKYFFYLYYPLHVYALTFLARALAS